MEKWLSVVRGQISRLYARIKAIERRVKRLEELALEQLKEEVEDWT